MCAVCAAGGGGGVRREAEGAGGAAGVRCGAGTNGLRGARGASWRPEKRQDFAHGRARARTYTPDCWTQTLERRIPVEQGRHIRECFLVDAPLAAKERRVDDVYVVARLLSFAVETVLAAVFRFLQRLH